MDSGPAATLTQPQDHSSEYIPQIHNRLLQLDELVQVTSENEDKSNVESEIDGADLSDLESGNEDMSHDPWPDESCHQISDPTLIPDELPSPSAGSRDINEGQFSSASTKNAEVDGNPLHELETEAKQHLLSSSQNPQPDVESSATALVLANEPPSDSVIKDST